MDIDLLSKMVKELILDHDRVALPGLGTFVAETVPSYFSDKGYTVNPPYRRLSFRPGTEDDGLLVGLYAAENKVSEEIAAAALEDFISGMKEVLEKKKNMVFPGLGRLRATKENNFFFVADEDLEIYPDGFGLEAVSLKTHVETKEEVSSALDVLKDMIVAPADETPAHALPSEEANPVAESPAEMDQEPESQSGPESDEPAQTETADPALEVPETADPAPESIEGADTAQEDHEEKDIEKANLEKEDVEINNPESDPEKSPGGKELEKEGKENEPVQASPEKKEDKAQEDTVTGLAGKPAEPVKKRKALYWVLISLAALVLLLVLYMVVARIFPEAIDSLLYSPEEYDLLH